MGYIFVLRHGPTYKQKLKTDKFEQKANDIVNYIKEFCKIDKIYTSPYKRCVQTTNIIRKLLNVSDIIVTKELMRANLKKETKDDVDLRAYKYGNTFRKIDENILIITHTSIIKPFVEGLCLKKLDQTYLHTACLSIYDSNRKTLEEYNKQWK